MSYFLKGNQFQFVLDKDDLYKVVQFIFDHNYVLFKDYADSEKEKEPITCISKVRYFTVESSLCYDIYMIVPKEEIELVSWIAINMSDGELRYRLDNLNARALQFIFSKKNSSRIGTGRIAICREWQDDNGNIMQATYEKEIYKELKSFVRKVSEGKVGGVFIGKQAFARWEKQEIELGYDIPDSLNWDIKEFKPLRKVKK